MRKRKKTPQGNPLLAVITLAGFYWLAQTSLHRETSYTQSAFSILPVSLNQRQASALKDLYSISDDDLAKPVNIFGE